MKTFFQYKSRKVFTHAQRYIIYEVLFETAINKETISVNGTVVNKL